MEPKSQAFVSKTTLGMLAPDRRQSLSAGDAASMVIPTSTPNVVVVKCVPKPLTDPVGTIKYKSVFDDEWPIFLKGKVDETVFRHTIDGINFFAELLHDAEVELYAEKFQIYDSWKDVHEYQALEETRSRIVLQLCKERGWELPPLLLTRPRITNDKDLRRYQQQIAKMLGHFIHDENEKHYTKKGIQWYSPEKNNWKWLEIHILPQEVAEASANAPPTPQKLYQAEEPSRPEFGNVLRIQVTDPLDVGDHTEYLVTITTNKESYYPYLHHRTLRRYNEFKDFFDDILAEMAKHNIYMQLPPLPEASFLGRKSKDTIKQRMLAFQELMNACARSPICDLPCMLKFLGIKPHHGSWRFFQYITPPTDAPTGLDNPGISSPKFKTRTL